MLSVSSRIPFAPQAPYRKVRPQTSKIIFLSCEGSVTEEEYFICISRIYSGIRSKIQFISVAEDEILTPPKKRTPDQCAVLSKVRPKQLVERIDQFRIQKEDIYQFSKYPEDEFWVVTDVDQNWSNERVNPVEDKTFREEWDLAITMCEKNGYSYAVSNPFFEIWLLLHHDNPSEEDRRFAVSKEHGYEKTNHFRKRLTDLGVPLKNQKHINERDYDDEKVRTAIRRAEELHIDKQDLCPEYLATTVYMLVKKMVDMIPNIKANGTNSVRT